MSKYKFTISIILINVLFFIFLTNKGLSFRTLVTHGGLLLVRGSLVDWTTLITYGFLHLSWEHLLYNMILGGVLMFYIEGLIGSNKLAVIYLLSIIVGGIAFVFYSNTTTMTVGASGGIYGIMGASVLILIKYKPKYYEVLCIFMLILLITELYLSRFNPSINYIGHLYGTFTGVLVSAILYKIKKNNWRLIK